MTYPKHENGNTDSRQTGLGIYQTLNDYRKEKYNFLISNKLLQVSVFIHGTWKFRWLYCNMSVCMTYCRIVFFFLTNHEFNGNHLSNDNQAIRWMLLKQLIKTKHRYVWYNYTIIKLYPENIIYSSCQIVKTNCCSSKNSNNLLRLHVQRPLTINLAT